MTEINMNENPTEEKKSQQTCFKLKASSLPMTTLQLLHTDFTHLAAELAATVSQAPKFFDHTPVIIDCQLIAHENPPLDFTLLLNTLRRYHMIPVGLRGGQAEQQRLAIEAGLAIFSKTTVEKKTSPTTAKTTGSTATANLAQAKVIRHPVRSGQQVYAKGSDLIILGAVSAGAECLADGNIHIYGPLRGRALAGLADNLNAHIFCASLEAELLAVAGQYCVSETLKSRLWQQSAHAYIKEGHLQIDSL